MYRELGLVLAGVFTGLAAQAVAQPQSDMPPWLVDQTADAGLAFTWISGHDGDFLMPEIVGGGVALLDYDGDGDLDVYFAQGGDLSTAWDDPAANPHINRLFRNDGKWSFTDVTETAGGGDGGYAMGVAVGDIDADGDPDLYITNAGRNTMLRNDGGVFHDITEASGTGHGGWGASAAFFDADGDGDLDLYATNYLNWTPKTEVTCYSPLGGEDYCSPRNYLSPALDVFYRNRGDGTFEDATVPTGFNTASGTGLGVIHGDWNKDGHPDLFVANDGMPDLLWVAKGDGTWVESGVSMGCALDDEGKAKAGMGVDTTDIDDDGDLDIIVCNLIGESDSLFRNDGEYFVDITGRTGIRAKSKHNTRFGLGWIDFDNDGWLDLYEASGAVTRLSVPEGVDPYAQEDMLLRGGPKLKFKPVQPRGGTDETISLTSRAAAFGDLDGDGGIDIVVVNRDAPANLYRNIAASRGNWVRLQILNEAGMPAIGAVVSGTTGKRTITRPVRRAYSYMASNEPTVHIGLGEAPAVEQVRVRWPDGQITEHGRLEAGKTHVLRKGSDSEG
ncbi:MAG: CRTAC1 family protein [Phycisphaerales bacterium]|jgi:hypothetical protein|nr:CRTAC1 family protein [Phycisphaerales bacterium]MDP6312029.1 CRTAC1 family protein [Phycisphaerales bacterium]MDP7087080.1 CRTAC1 family protein [Phycisphaerales bacterium]MDP7189028.1 CRTAC1 family protein [Phycisphaerales bacterium]